MQEALSKLAAICNTSPARDKTHFVFGEPGVCSIRIAPRKKADICGWVKGLASGEDGTKWLFLYSDYDSGGQVGIESKKDGASLQYAAFPSSVACLPRLNAIFSRAMESAGLPSDKALEPSRLVRSHLDDLARPFIGSQGARNGGGLSWIVGGASLIVSNDVLTTVEKTGIGFGHPVRLPWDLWKDSARALKPLYAGSVENEFHELGTHEILALPEALSGVAEVMRAL